MMSPEAAASATGPIQDLLHMGPENPPLSGKEAHDERGIAGERSARRPAPVNRAPEQDECKPGGPCFSDVRVSYVGEGKGSGLEDAAAPRSGSPKARRRHRQRGAHRQSGRGRQK